MNWIAFFGLPTAGKSTLSNLVARELSIPQINVGELLRNRGPQNINVANGLLLGNKYVSEIVLNELRQTGSSGFILDGYPRNLVQFKHFQESGYSRGCCYILLKMDVDTARNRYMDRANCPQCKRAFYAKALRDSAACPRCKGKLMVRKDRNTMAMQNKFKEFFVNEQPLINQLQLSQRLFSLNVKGIPENDLQPLLGLIRGSSRGSIDRRANEAY